MTTRTDKIGLALSGGGIRAAVFHLGMLRYLAEQNRLETITYLSTVSGGSLLTGLIYSQSIYSWPTSEYFLQSIHPNLKEIFTQKSLQSAALKKLLFNYKNWPKIIHRANIMGDTIHDYWEVKGKLSNIPHNPTWAVNGTTSETGKRWRFKDGNMGDYMLGYVDDVDFKVADVMAISAAFPRGIGPYKLATKDYEWYRYDSWKSDAKKIPTTPPFKNIYLSDGRLYDNLGLESVYDPSERNLKSKTGISYLIISDASSPLEQQKRGFFWQVFRRTKRMIDIIYDQVRMLRIRGIVPFFIDNQGKGIYLQLGLSPKEIHAEYERHGINIPQELRECDHLSGAELNRAKNYPTNLKSMSPSNFRILEQHGYESAKHLFEIFPPKTP